jgi:hypothetical protein
MTPNENSIRHHELVDLGAATELTGLAGSPVRDNGHDNPPDYFDASKASFVPASGEYDV